MFLDSKCFRVQGREPAGQGEVQLDGIECWERKEGGDGGRSNGTFPNNLRKPVRERVEREALQAHLKRLEEGISDEVLVAGPQESP